MYPGCIADTNLFREKRSWFRFFFFPNLMKAIGSYVTEKEVWRCSASSNSSHSPFHYSLLPALLTTPTYYLLITSFY